MSTQIDSRQFMRAGLQRFEAANVLLHNQMNLDAIHLAGYTVECALKALLTARTPRSRQKTFKGSGWHSFERIKGELGRRGVNLPPRIYEALRRVQTWTTDLRYAVGSREAEESTMFCTAARTIYDWVKEQLP